MSITVRFACGHTGNVGLNQTASPVCHCGETRVTQTVARAPRFSGACSGPYAEMKTVEPAIVDVATAGPLTLKPQE